MPFKAKVRYIRFSPEEMATDVDDAAEFMPVRRGKNGLPIRPGKEEIDAWKRLKSDGSFVRLDPDVRKAFPSDKSVNAALRRMIEPQADSEAKPPPRKKSA